MLKPRRPRRSGGEEEFEGLRIDLLADIRGIFEGKRVDRMFSEGLAAILVDLEERPWTEYSRGKPLTKAKLAYLLRPSGQCRGRSGYRTGRRRKGIC